MVLHFASDVGKFSGGAARPTRRRLRVEEDMLTYQLLYPRRVGPADVALIGEAYRCWSQVWSETLRELDGVDDVPSDEFTRQDEIGAIFHGYECVALACFRWVDLSLPMTLGDSYFQIWPDDAREAAAREGTRVCIGSHLTVAPEWRRVRGCSLRHVIAALTIDRFLVTDDAAILGTMRDDRGMGGLVHALGATSLGRAQLHGVPVSLIAVYRGAQRQPLDEQNERIVSRLRRAFAGVEQ